MSGPAILRLSSIGARVLNEMNYNFIAQISWVGNINEERLREMIGNEVSVGGKGKISNKNPLKIPGRLWLHLLTKLEISPEKKWNELGKKDMNRLVSTLTNDEYKVEGKTTFKEEFVTCGGVSLDDVSIETMESKKCPGLYFAGEVLDIDGVTGGFNFQAAWSTAYIAGKLAA
jgi:predicted Rossmann fold flavoprotein